MLTITANNSTVVVDSPSNTAKRLEYTYRPYKTGTISYSEDRLPTVTRIEVNEESSFATMIASEALLAQDWDTPEEDEAWANLQKVILS